MRCQDKMCPRCKERTREVGPNGKYRTYCGDCRRAYMREYVRPEKVVNAQV